MKSKKSYKYYVVYYCYNIVGSCRMILEKPIIDIEDVKEVSSYIAKHFCDNADKVIVLNWKELKG